MTSSMVAALHRVIDAYSAASGNVCQADDAAESFVVAWLFRQMDVAADHAGPALAG